MANFKIALAVHTVKGLPGSAKSLLLHLSLYTSAANGGRIYASLGLLAHTSGYSQSTIQRDLSYLQREGWIAVEGERKQRIKGYAIVLEKLGLTLEDTQPKRKPAAPAAEHSAQAAHASQFTEGNDDYPEYENGLAAASPHPRRRGKGPGWQTEEQKSRMEKAFGFE